MTKKIWSERIFIQFRSYLNFTYVEFSCLIWMSFSFNLEKCNYVLGFSLLGFEQLWPILRRCLGKKVKAVVHKLITITEELFYNCIVCVFFFFLIECSSYWLLILNYLNLSDLNNLIVNYFKLNALATSYWFKLICIILLLIQSIYNEQ